MRSWQAHGRSIVSLVASVSAHTPPALVSTDLGNEVKIWSTAGDLWGHFHLRGNPPSAEPAVEVWPPPHVLAQQLTVMRLAKGLCKKLNLQTRKIDEKETPPPRSKKDETQARKEALKRGAGTRHRGSAEDAAGEPQAVGSRRRRPGARGNHAHPFFATELADSRQPACSSQDNLPFGDDSESESPARDMRNRLASSGADSAGSGGDDASAGPSARAESSVSAPPAPKRCAIDDIGREAAAPPNSDDGADAAPGVSEAEEDEDGEEANFSPPSGGSGKVARQMTAVQMQEMLRNNAFSNGYRTHGAFRRGNPQSRSSASALLRGGESPGQLEAQHRSLVGSPASAFGIRFSTLREEENWERSSKRPSMGGRASSEGALLSYARCAVEDMRKTVQDELSVDVSRVTLKQMRKPTFVRSLDVRRVATQATMSASLRLSSPEPARGTALELPKRSALGGAGAGMMNSRNPAKSKNRQAFW